MSLEFLASTLLTQKRSLQSCSVTEHDFTNFCAGIRVQVLRSVFATIY